MPERHRILIVDDDAADRQAVVRALRREAAEIDGVEADVLEAGTIAQAREALQREEFACVFLDHSLPDGTSLDLLMELRSQGLATPVVVLTGERDEQAIIEVMRAGAVDYLPKERLHPDLVARSLRASLRFLQVQREKQAVLDELRARDRAIAAASNGIVIADPRQPNCPLIYANEAFLEMTGYAQGEAIGRNCHFLQGPDTDPAAVQELREAIRAERSCQVLLLNYRKDGSTFWNEVTVSPVRDARGILTHFVGVQTDVTARQTAETERQAAEQALHEAHQRTEAMLESITDAFIALDTDWRITRINDQAERLIFHRREGLLGKNFWEAFPQPAGSQFERQYRRAVGEGVAVSFEEFSPRLNAWFEVRAYPSSEGLSIFFQNVNERKQSDEALRRSREDLRLAIDAARLGTFYCDWPLDKIIWNDTCKEHFFLPHDAEVDINLFYSLIHPDDRETTRLAIERAMAERVEYDVEYRTLAADGRTRWVNAVERFYYGPDGNPTRFDGITLDISARKTSEEEIRRRAEQAALLNHIGQSLRATADPKVIQERAASLLGAALGADRCFYVTYDLTRDHAQISFDWHREDVPSLAGDYKASDFGPLLGELFPAQATAVVDDVQLAFSPAVASIFEASRHRAAIVVPFFNEGNIVAALYVSMADAPRAWTEEETGLVEQVATLTRTSLAAALVRERERRIAQQLQDALQPSVPKQVLGLSIGSQMLPALNEASVGGDFYDVFPLDKELYALVIGDVSGKGLAAAQQLALVRNSLRTTLYLYRAPAQAAASLNALVTAHDLLAGFVTAFVGVYDAGAGRIAYASCGHEPGLIRRANGVVEELETTGPPLGVQENAAYDEGQITLATGDSLLLYTDGISEAGPNRRELLGTQGLMRLFAGLMPEVDVQAQAEALVAQVSAYAGGVFRDDVAVLLARRQ